MRNLMQHEKDVFLFLNELRESGVTNMFGATPYIMEKFDMERDDARMYLSAWMEIFNADGKYETIDETLLPS